MSAHLKRHHISSSEDHSFTGLTQSMLLALDSNNSIMSTDIFTNASGTAYGIGTVLIQTGQKVSINGAIGVTGASIFKANATASVPLTISPFGATQSGDLWQILNSSNVKRLYVDSLLRFVTLTSVSIGTTLNTSALTVSGGASVYDGLNVTGDSTFLNYLILSASPTANSHAVTLGYLNSITGSFGGGTNSNTVSTSGSLTGGGSVSANPFISLINDSTSPGNSKYYGTDSSGIKGYFTLPTGSGSTGSATGNYVSLDGNESISGIKTFINPLSINGFNLSSTSGNLVGNPSSTSNNNILNTTNSIIIQGVENSISSSTGVHVANGMGNTILSASDSYIRSGKNNTITSSSYSTILNGNNNNINNSNRSTVFGGRWLSINDSDESYIFGSGTVTGNFINNISQSVLFGWNGEKTIQIGYNSISAFKAIEINYTPSLTTHAINKGYVDALFTASSAVNASTYVTIDTSQNITGLKTFTGLLTIESIKSNYTNSVGGVNSLNYGIIASRNSLFNNSVDSVIFSSNNSQIYSSQSTGVYNNSIIGSTLANITANQTSYISNVILGTVSSSILNTQNTSIISSRFSTIGPSGGFQSIIASTNSSISANQPFDSKYSNAIIGSSFCNIENTQTTVIAGGLFLTGSAGSNNFMGGGGYNGIFNGFSSTILGGRFNSVLDGGAIYSSIIGGISNSLSGSNGVENSVIVGGEYNNIKGSGNRARRIVIVGGIYNIATYAGTDQGSSVLIGGEYNTLTNAKDSVMVGGSYNSMFGVNNTILGSVSSKISGASVSGSIVFGGRLLYVSTSNSYIFGSGTSAWFENDVANSALFGWNHSPALWISNTSITAYTSVMLPNNQPVFSNQAITKSYSDGNTISANANYSASSNDKLILANGTGGAINIYLPNPLNYELVIKRTNSGGSNITVSALTGTIQGSVTASLTAQYQYIRLMQYDNVYYIV